MPGEPDRTIGWSTLLGMGALIAAQFAVGLGLGWLIDWAAGTSPIFLLIGLLFGITGAVTYTVVEFRKILKS